jgi:DNA mismatch endonuclease (patch repair protein)
MRRVRQKDTPAEMRLRHALWRRGLRYYVHRRVEGTRPDIVFPRRRVAVFVDGCFWHGCPEHYVLPANNRSFWQNKLDRIQNRDVQDSERLRDAGWRVVRLWECEVFREQIDIVERVRMAVRGPASDGAMDAAFIEGS